MSEPASRSRPIAACLLAHRLAGDDSLRPSPLLAQPLPRFPFPALRRTYQRAMYAYYELQDRR